jgi:hypothetical protein
MLNLDGYRVRECIHETPHSAVYTGTRTDDGLRVVLKLYRGAQDDAGTARAQREFELLERIHDAGVVRPVEVRADGDRHILIVEEVPGEPLSRYVDQRRFAVTEVLQIGIGITRSLAAVHDARVIHKDLKPGNILVDLVRGSARLIDFGISAEFGRAERTQAPERVEGTMRYMAPEQTGRVGRGLDFRTDLYSLGVILYELLAGRPPFRAATALELISAHIAVQPRPLVDVDARIPLALSRLVAKLLEKDPERRYQTARGLAADLERCQKQLREAGEIDDDLALGSEDASDRLRFPHRIYGRERECAELEAAFARVAQGARELVLLAGPAGIGKSALPSVLRERLARAGGYLAEAKFDPELRERPYAGFAAAFTGWVEQILPEPRERHAMWGERIRSSVGPIGRALVGLAPNLGYIVPDFPSLPTLPAQEARERLALAVLRFVRAVARTAHPLVLSLDDLQWADAGSLALLGALLRSSEPEALLVIGGFRDNEVDAEHGLSRLLRDVGDAPTPIRRIDLAPLGIGDTARMLAEALGRTPAETEGLARLVGSKSQHNPLLVRRLMFHLWDRNLVRHEHGRGWVWDERSIAEAEITDDAAAMIAARIDALAPQAHELVKVASVIGTLFDPELLASLAGMERADVLPQLMGLVDQGLIAPCREGFKFVHDRLREAAQSRLSGDERAALHHRAARLLLERTPAERVPLICFELAEHLSAALDRLSEEERPRAIDVMHQAGRAALERGAAEPAAHYLGFARALLSEQDWQERRELAFEVQLRSAEAAFQTERFSDCLQMLQTLLALPLAPLQRARVLAQRISIAEVDQSSETLELVLEALRQFGVSWPRTPSRLRARLEVLRTDWVLRGPLDERAFPPRQVSDMSWLPPVLIISAGIAAMADHSNALACIATGYVLRRYRRYSYSRNPGQPLAAYACFRISVLRSLAGARRYAVATAAWAQLDDSQTQTRSRLGFQNLHASDIRLQFALSLLHSWLKSRRSVLESFQRVAEDALELGDVEFAYYALHHHAAFAALSGERLPQLARRFELLRRHQPRGGKVVAAQAYQRAYGLLVDGDGSAPDETGLQGGTARSEDLNIGIQQIAVRCLLGDFARAFAAVERLWPRILGAGAIGSRVADYLLFRGLCHAVRAESTRGYLERRRHLRTVRSCFRQLRTWARSGPDFVHMAQLLQAELAAARGRRPAALQQYRDAAQRARDVGYAHHAALCHERRAALFERMRRGTEAHAELTAAMTLYEEWGARAKVRRLDAQRSAL